MWRTVKYEEVYLDAYSDGWETEISLAQFLWRYCHVRPHSSLKGKTPHEVYTETEPFSSRPELTISGARADPGLIQSVSMGWVLLAVASPSPAAP